MARKYFSNTAVATTLSASISDSDSSLTVNSSTGYPAVPFAIAINAGTSSEEVILVGAKSGTTFSSLTRGHDTTTARAHTSGASIKHVATAEDFTGLWTHDHDTADGHTAVDVTDATGLLPTSKGGTGLSSLGSAGQVMKINSSGNALEYGNVEAVLNIDGMTDGSGITIADTDDFAISDAGTEKKVNASQIKSYVGIRTDEEIADVVGAMFSGNTETRIAVTYEDGDGTIDLVVDDMTANTQLTTEQVEDIVGGMLDGTETFISVSYDDDGGANIDFVVPVLDEDDMSTDSATHLATQQSIKAYVDATVKTEEEIEDFVGGMLGGTETFITVTYQDSTGDIDFVVPVKDEDNMASDSATFLATQQSIKAYVDTHAALGTHLTLIDEDDFSTNSATRPPSQQSVKAYVDANAGNTDEEIQDLVGAMFTGNTETGITATYQDGDGTIDLVVSASSDVVIDADSDTKIQVEEGSDEDKIRFDTAGTERGVWDVAGPGLTTNGGVFRHHQTQAATYTVAANEGSVMAGPITITGTVTNAGTMVVL
tara:strand:- start:896 stop:2521 length:1626 start_codon:yes stop_codon:yes gene_type:complete